LVGSQYCYVPHHVPWILSHFIGCQRTERANADRDERSHARSYQGTKTTKSFIDKESEYYVGRDDSSRTKYGSKEKKTDSAHIMSFGLADVIRTRGHGTHDGKPLTEEGKKEFCKAMSNDSNLRIKSAYGNRVLDERRDARIADAYVNGHAMEGKTTQNRAYQALRSCDRNGMDDLSRELGNMNVRGESGRNHKLKNHGRFK
jgi:hypothetical protein